MLGAKRYIKILLIIIKNNKNNNTIYGREIDLKLSNNN